MYSKLTELIPLLKKDYYGTWIIDSENDGTLENPKEFPFIKYSEVIDKLICEIYNFEHEHPEFGLNDYKDIIETYGFKWNSESMKNADVSNLDGKVVMAFLLGIVRADRFVLGTLLEFCRNGTVIKWLERLKELDETIL